MFARAKISVKEANPVVINSFTDSVDSILQRLVKKNSHLKEVIQNDFCTIALLLNNLSILRRKRTFW